MSKVVVRLVQPAHLNGVRPGELVLNDLHDGLTVICAPNASGKSTLAEAIGLLFRPNERSGDFSVTGLIEVAGTPQDRTTHAKSPGFEGFNGRAKMYRLDLMSLVSGLDQDDRMVLMRTLGTEGILPPGELPKVRSQVHKSAATALEELRKARDEKGRLAEEEDRLPDLAKKVEEASGAARLLQHVEDWLEKRSLLASITRLTEQISVLEAEHPGVKNQIPNASGELAARLQGLDRTSAELYAAQEAFGRIAPDGRTPSTQFSAVVEAHLSELLDIRQKCLGSVDSWRTAFHSASKQAETQRSAVFAVLEESPEELVLPSAEDFLGLKVAVTEADEARRARIEREAWIKLREWWEREKPESADELDQELSALLDWLRFEPVPATDLRPAAWLRIALLGVAVGLLPTVALRLSVGALMVAIALLVNRLLKPHEGIARPDLTGKVPLETITVDTVVGRIRSGLEAQSRARGHQRIADLVNGQAIGDVPTEGWPSLAEKLKLRCQDPLRLSAVADSISGYLSSVAAATNTRVQLVEALAALDTAEEQIINVLRRHEFYDYELGLDAQVRVLPAWFSSAQKLAQSQTSLTQEQESVDSYLTQQGVPSGELSERAQTLREREPVVQELAALRAELKDLQRQEALLNPDLDRLRAHTGSVILEAVSEERWDEIQASLQRDSDDLAERIAQRQRITHLLERAERSTDLNGKQQIYAAEIAKLEVKYRDQIAAVAQFRVRQMLNERRGESLPKLVANANAYLARFTMNRYQLELGNAADELGSLNVRDHDKSLRQKFSELSTGTRVHVIIALRLGLIEEQEAGGLRFPLIVDEATAVSDASATRSISKALVEIAKDRQVIVFTNQAEDYALFKELDPSVRTATIGHRIPETYVPAVLATPYVRRPGPQNVDLQLALRRHHPSLVLFDDELALAAEATTIESALSVLGPEVELRVSAFEVVHARVAEATPRLEWADISKQNWVTGTYREQMLAALEEVDGSPDDFLKKISDLRGIRTATVASARSFLEEKGLLERPKPLRKDLIHAAKATLGATPNAQAVAEWIVSKYDLYVQ